MSDQNTSLPLEFPTGAPARKETMSSLVVSHKALIADLETPNDPFDGVPVNAVQATLEHGVAEDNTAMKFTAVTYGIIGNNLSVTIERTSYPYYEVTLNGHDLLATAGAMYRMEISGTLSPEPATSLKFYATDPIGYAWSSNGTETPDAEGFYTRLSLVDGTHFTLAVFEDAVLIGSWTATETESSDPSGLTYVADDAETGTPTIASKYPSTQDFMNTCQTTAAINGLILTAANGGDATGELVALETTFLAGGIDGTPGKRGRLANDDASIWYCMTTDLTAQNHGWIELAQAT